MAQLTHRPENPIEYKEEDRLDRAKFVVRLADAIINRHTQKSTGIVIGITGAWGCGKSSVLNLLREHVSQTYPDALIIKFNPWLVSGRNDIIAEFFGELIGTIRSDLKRQKQIKRLSTTIAKYGAKVAPIGNIVLPGIGTAASAGFKTVQDALSTSTSLPQLRDQLVGELERLPNPIVVLIDELDRVEDEEIRSVVQLVRSVADFPRVSYVLAYDTDRVALALGSGSKRDERVTTGKEYLEKIVQFQIPMPIVFNEEVRHLLASGLHDFREEGFLLADFEKDKRYQELVEILCDGIIETLRDIHRLLGTFHALVGMLQGEVDPIDIIAYSALLVKAPATVAKMQQDPDAFLGDMLSPRNIKRFFEDEKLSPPDKLAKLLPAPETNESIFALVQYLLPAFKSPSERSRHPDAFDRRRAFLTTLRLGLVPGAYSRKQVEELIGSGRDNIASELHESYERGVLRQLIDRIAEIYMEVVSEHELEFWAGVARFVRKPDCDWMRSYSPMYRIVRDFCEMVEEHAAKDPTFRGRAVTIFMRLREQGDIELTATWLRKHFFVYGLHGCKEGGGNHWFFSSEQSEQIAKAMCTDWRDQHMAGRLVPSLWGLGPVYAMIETGIWDDECRAKLDESLCQDDAVDGLALLLFGGENRTGVSSIMNMCNFDLFISRAKERLAAAGAEEMHETVRWALREACGET